MFLTFNFILFSKPQTTGNKIDKKMARSTNEQHDKIMKDAIGRPHCPLWNISRSFHGLCAARIKLHFKLLLSVQ